MFKEARKKAPDGVLKWATHIHPTVEILAAKAAKKDGQSDVALDEVLLATPVPVWGRAYVIQPLEGGVKPYVDNQVAEEVVEMMQMLALQTDAVNARESDKDMVDDETKEDEVRVCEKQKAKGGREE